MPQSEEEINRLLEQLVEHQAKRPKPTRWQKVASVARGAGIAAAGAALTYLIQWVSGADFGELTPALVAVLSVLANAVRKAAT